MAGEWRAAGPACESLALGSCGGCDMAVRILCAAVLIASASMAVAAEQSDAFDACAAEKDPTARVACFDRALAARQAAQQASKAAGTSAAPRPATAATKPPSVRTPDSDVGLSARELRRQREARGEPPPQAPAPITARVVKVFEREPLISVFELDNGQAWEQSEAVKVWASPRETVTISHGVLGAFFLKTADGTVVRVHRVR